MPMDAQMCLKYCDQVPEGCAQADPTSSFMDPECLCFSFGTTCGGCTAAALPPTPPPPTPPPPTPAMVYKVLNFSKFVPLLAEDSTWAAENVPLFESSDVKLTRNYYFRWRTYKRHVHATGRTDGINWVVTEFTPNVSWAGHYNTINCAAGHHIQVTTRDQLRAQSV